MISYNKYKCNVKRGSLNHMKKTVMTIIIIFLIIICISCSNTNNEKKRIELTISAAASMQKALTELQGNYEQEHPNVRLLFNYGATGALQQQIEQGAPVDVFFSASEEKFVEVLEKGFVEKQNSVDLVSNELVLIQNKQSNYKISGFAGLADSKIKRISIGTPESVPAGKYAKETLESQNLWLQIEEKIVFAKDVRQVLTYVESGNVDAGIVYKTDAILSKKIEIVGTADPKSHSPIIYPLGVVKKSKQKEESIKFYHYLQSDKAKELFENYGFHFLLK
jgi:molybdate transport system substrate-binding protein